MDLFLISGAYYVFYLDTKYNYRYKRFSPDTIYPFKIEEPYILIDVFMCKDAGLTLTSVLNADIIVLTEYEAMIKTFDLKIFDLKPELIYFRNPSDLINSAR